MSLEPGLAPAGLVFVLYDAAGAELDRFAAAGIGPGAPSFDLLERVAEGHAEAVLERGGLVRVFDGDTGEVVAAIGTA